MGTLAVTSSFVVYPGRYEAVLLVLQFNVTGQWQANLVGRPGLLANAAGFLVGQTAWRVQANSLEEALELFLGLDVLGS